MIVFVWTEIKICVYYRLRLQSSSCGRSLHCYSSRQHQDKAYAPREIRHIPAWSKRQRPIRRTLSHAQESLITQQDDFSVLFGRMTLNNKQNVVNVWFCRDKAKTNYKTLKMKISCSACKNKNISSNNNDNNNN